MPGAHGLAVYADALVKGVAGASAAVGARMAHAALDAQDAGAYAALGYVPFDEHDNAASLTLDYAFDDAVGALLAEAAGDAGAAAAWRARAGSYKNLFRPDVAAACPRFANGTWPPCPPLDLAPILLNKYYTEGDGLQYTFAVPHDVEGLRALFPSDAAYVELLQGMMANTTAWPTNALPNPFYWAGNEPGLLAPWQFSLVPSDAWRTQYWVRWILDTYYDDVPDGVPGNDDEGELNAWAVWACLGLYPLAATPGGTYVLTSPCFADTTVGAGTPGALRIVAHNFSASNVYVARAAVGGAALATPFVNHSALFTGNATLEFWLDDAPHVWGGARVE